MTVTKPKLALCMIVKDEAHVIRETLENVSKYIDYYVINDTGSTDNTKEIIKEYFDSINIPGEIITHEFRKCTCHGPEYKKYSFFHFGWNRSYAIKCCEGKSEYIWVMDADDLVIGEMDLSNLTEDCYQVTYGKDFTYLRPQIFRNDSTYNWHYKDPLHEYLDCDKKNYRRGILPGKFYIDSRRLGARNKDPQKYLKDALVFEEMLKENPNNDRYIFYGAQSYYDYQDYENAMRMYKKRASLGGWFEEVFYSYYKVAMAMEHLKMPWKDSENAYLDAYKYCKQRAEPLYNIALHYRFANDFQNGYKWAKKASQIPFPNNCQLFVYKDMYDYKIADEVAINAYYLGKYHESYSISKKLLELNVVPGNELERINKNIEFCKQKLNEKSKKLCCIFVGNEIVNKDSVMFKLINFITKQYKVLIVGEKLDQYYINNVMVCKLNSFKTLDKLKVDYLILYNSLNYFYTNSRIDATYTILLQNDNLIKILLDNGMYLGIHNQEMLTNIFNKIKIDNIVCSKKDVRDTFVNDYGLESKTVIGFDPDNENDTYLIFEENKNKYTFKTTLGNETNGLLYLEPNYIKFMKENKDVYDFSKKLILNFYEDIQKQFPTMPEHYYKLASINIEFSDYITASICLDKALDLVKKNKTYNNYKDVINRDMSKRYHY